MTDTERDEQNLRAVVAYLTFKSYRKAGLALACDHTVIFRRVKEWREDHQRVLPPYATATTVYASRLSASMSSRM